MTEQLECAERDSATSGPTVDLETLNHFIEVAEDYERALARRQYRVRKLVLNLKAYRDARDEFGAVIWKGARP